MKSKVTFALLVAILMHSAPAIAKDSDEGRRYIKIYGGTNFLSDKSYDQANVAAVGATGTSSFDAGMIAGAAVGYFFTDNTAAEITWDYRRNESDNNTFSDGANFSSGDYASNIFFLNGFYHFDRIIESKLRPYLGAGLGYVEEIDLDLEAGSYSSGSELATQLIAGTSYFLSNSWDLNADVRYVRASSMNLDQENGAGTIKGINYNHITLSVGAVYKF